jgi:DNA-binding beta-propeller fold protein YncE
MTKSFRILLACFVLATIPHLSHAQSPSYHLLKKTIIGGEGGWDYLSIAPLRQQLFIAHAKQVDVYDLKTDAIVGHIMNTQGVHGVAVAGPEDHGFISCGQSNSVLMFDLQTLDTLKRIPVGEKPDAIIYDPATNHVFVMNGKSESITVLGAKSGNRITTIQLPGGPEFAVADGRGHVYVNLEDKSQVVQIDSRSNKIEHTWTLSPGEGPTGIAMDPKTDRLFIGCANQTMIVMDAKHGNILKVLPIGKGVDAVAFDPSTKQAFSSNGEGNVTIVREVNPKSFEVAQTLETQRGARTIALNPKTHNIYLITADFGPTPEATKEKPHPRPQILPNTFVVLKYGMEKK